MTFAQIRDLAVVENLPKLKLLNLSGCDLKAIDLTPLKNLSDLNDLRLYDCNIEFIPQFISEWQNFDFVYFGSDWTPQAFRKEIDLRENRNIKNIHPKIQARGKVPIAELFSESA